LNGTEFEKISNIRDDERDILTAIEDYLRLHFPETIR
jgi:hypothetical protein